MATHAAIDSFQTNKQNGRLFSPQLEPTSFRIDSHKKAGLALQGLFVDFQLPLSAEDGQQDSTKKR